ncbi:sulfotransferase family protein [Streptosporangium sp. CA-115845]|uniref:sulfotransferase-like domain-containing protein n=1 Tax=Streptosporangium sp. CA-115845 TaxID=3240071 RepID=UPI003D907ADA
MQTVPKVLALWSAPRCRSTAFFRMMCERGDFHVLHEPFSYLAEFGEVEVDGRTKASEHELIAAIRGLAERGPLFFKDTTDERYPGVIADPGFLSHDGVHTFLIRSPVATIASYQAINPDVGLHQIGFEALYEIFSATWERTGTKPVVMDADDLVADPVTMTRAYCARVDIDFVESSLTWRPESRPEWRPSRRWHVDVSESSGFRAARRDYRVDVATHPVFGAYLRHHLPFYEELYAHRLLA